MILKDLTLKFRGKEVKNAIGRVSLLLLMVLFTISSLLLHPILRLCGRRGFFKEGRKPGSFEWTSEGAFGKDE